MEDPYQCNYCLQKYDDNVRAPMTLNCGHSYCSSCIFEQKLMNQQLSCKRCNKVDSQPFEQMSKNFTLINMLQSQIQMSQSGNYNPMQQYPNPNFQNFNPQFSNFQNNNFQQGQDQQSLLGNNNPFSGKPQQQTFNQQSNQLMPNQESPKQLKQYEDVENIIQEDEFDRPLPQKSIQKQQVKNQELTPRTLQLIADGHTLEEALQLRPFLEQKQNTKTAQEVQDEFYAQQLAAKLNSPQEFQARNHVARNPANRNQAQNIGQPYQNDVDENFDQVPVLYVDYKNNQQNQRRNQERNGEKKQNKKGCCFIY